MDQAFSKQMKRWRTEIDQLDSQLLELVKRRVSIAKKIMATKKSKGMPVTNKKREQEIAHRMSQQAAKMHLSRAFSVSLIRKIIQEGKKKS